ncbi:hypothetical protein N7478_011139 [Penicillium angulare]|uniref:uncharacterized protein n=1 Tax=Penicillium angulare TaxID=116970 RepID=UPI002541B703|nr:uncharacterized protein N7478_011139 [Penicillium angulare]KAJ5263534.1 hypothetical protein N7478_011139 [Penicillium angulare]
MSDPRRANEKALEAIKVELDKLHLPAWQRNLLKDLIGKIPNNKNLYDLQNQRWGPVVQVVTTVSFDARPTRNEVEVKLDVDIPPPNSTQKPHIGFEVKLNGKLWGNGHIWVDENVLHAGRPKLKSPVQLQEYGCMTDEIINLEQNLPSGVQLDVKFYRFRGA